MASGLSRERAVMLVILALALVGGLLGLADPPAEGVHSGEGDQVLDLLRILTMLALTVSLLLGPGVVWRLLSGRDPPAGLAFLALPGMLILGGTGVIAWALGGSVDPRTTCFAVMVPVLGLLLGSLLYAGPEDVFTREERQCLVIVGCVLGLAVGRVIWSLGPEGEVYDGTISRTFEVGDRPDSRISFILPQLVANHEGPFAPVAVHLFFPYDFSSRGPLPGLASTPLVLLAGGHPPTEYPEKPWTIFDHEGFQAYRLAMMTFGCTAFVAVWDLVRRLAGFRAARLALLLAATTPFLVHEVWFTWPKMLAAALVLASAICVISRRPLAAGVLIGVGYLMHPVALLSLPALALIALWPLKGARLNRPQVMQLVMFGVGLAVFLIAWRLVNGSHYDQSDFVDYLTHAGSNVHPSLGEWVVYRWKSVTNTLVPMLLPFTASDSPSLNVLDGTSPFSIHFFFQYWTTTPFGVAIVFFPVLLVGLWRASRRWAWAVIATVLVPLLAFAVYWGASTSGMMREGLQAWTLTLFAVIGCEQAASGFGWLRSRAVRTILVLRVAEVLAMILGPVIATRHAILAEPWIVSDVVALALILGFAACLAWLVWSAEPPGDEPVTQ